MRKFHKKSRLGCKQCKWRRSKCDETRPSCGRCSQAGHQCSFLTERPALPSALPLPTSHLSSPSPSSDPSLDKHYGSLHLRLLYHFEHDLYYNTKSLHHGLRDLLGLFIEVAFVTPYLMDELLAYSAAHKSTVDRDRRQFYLSEATRLQTQALALYNGTGPEVSKDTCLPMFLFSSLLSHHVIFGMSSAVHNGLGPVIDELTCSIAIHRGLITIAKKSWPMFSKQDQERFTRSCERDYMPIPSGPESKGECDALLRRLDACDTGPESIAMLRSAVETLQGGFDTLSTNNSHAMWAAVQDWLVAVPTGYIKLLNQRRPEALVVLAYFAVLLHQVAAHWFVGDLGISLLNLVNDYLGPAWEDWLEWPSRSMTEKP
jgi:hypothetical protein